MMKRIILFLVLRAPLWAQTPANGALGFTHDNTGTTRYELRIDGTTTVVPATPLSGTPGDYTVPLPVIGPGAHTLILTACSATACASSVPYVITVPRIPMNLRITITIQINGDNE